MRSEPLTKEDGDYCSKGKGASVNTRAQKIARLRNKEYRDAFVASQINVGLPFQIRFLREQREWKQSQLADRTGMLQPRISAIESPGGAKFTLETLRRLASAFDVALIVKFAPFSELVDQSADFNPDTFCVSSFGDDLGLVERKEPQLATTANVPVITYARGETERTPYGCGDVPTASNRLLSFPVPQVSQVLYAEIG